MCMWMSGDRLRELALSFYHLRTGERIQVTGLGGKCLSPLSQLAGPSLSHGMSCSAFTASRFLKETEWFN